MTQLKYLNLGCGRIILPAPKPQHYGLLDDAVCSYALYHNVDRNPEPGVDETLDIFRYPFPWADSSFDGALVAHVAEHISHEIRLTCVHEPFQETPIEQPTQRHKELSQMQDGWFCFWSEVWRVCTAGSIIHVLSPYAWSDGAMHDPSHTRYLTPASFQHSMVPNPDAPFAYATGGLHLEMVEPPRYNIAESFQHLIPQRELLQRAVDTQINVVSEFAVKLRVVK